MAQTQQTSETHNLVNDSLKQGYAQLATRPDSEILLGQRLKEWAVTNNDSVIQMNANALMAEAAQQLCRVDTSTEYYLSAIAIARAKDLPNKLSSFYNGLGSNFYYLCRLCRHRFHIY